MEFSTQKTTPEYLKEIADREKQLRKQLKLSQRELAERSGVSLGSLKRFESTGQIALESLVKLAQILETTEQLNQLFPPQDDMSHIESLFSSKTRE
jgi:transcriptional regulator with XRE-family HTH domain